MKQIIWAAQFIIKRKFIFFLAVGFLLIPTVAYTQVVTPPGEQMEILPDIKPNLPNNQGFLEQPPYGAIVMMQKPISCNDTPVIKNYIQNMNGMVVVTMGTDKNQMGAITSLIQVYANPINKRFAIVEHFAAQKSCIIHEGHDFDIILPKNSRAN